MYFKRGQLFVVSLLPPEPIDRRSLHLRGETLSSESTTVDLLIVDTDLTNGNGNVTYPFDPTPKDVMLNRLSVESEAFASGSILLAKALDARYRIVIGANMSKEADCASSLSFWECTHDDDGINLIPIPADVSCSNLEDAEHVLTEIIDIGTKGDVLVVCDPWGDNELFCWALQLSKVRAISTISITTDQPNLLAALAQHAIRVPVVLPYHRENMIAALRQLIHAATDVVIPASRRAIGELREIKFD